MLTKAQEQAEQEIIILKRRNTELIDALKACYLALMNETGVGVCSHEKKLAEQALR